MAEFLLAQVIGSRTTSLELGPSSKAASCATCSCRLYDKTPGEHEAEGGLFEIEPAGVDRATYDRHVETDLERHRGQHFVGRIDDHVKDKGWFFGAFAAERLLTSELVEVAWQQLSNVSPSPEQEHFHQKTVEINIVIAGWIELTIDGVQHRLDAREFYVIWPESTVSDIKTGPDTELIVVRAPGIPGDKVEGKPE